MGTAGLATAPWVNFWRTPCTVRSNPFGLARTRTCAQPRCGATLECDSEWSSETYRVPYHPPEPSPTISFVCSSSFLISKLHTRFFTYCDCHFAPFQTVRRSDKAEHT